MRGVPADLLPQTPESRASIGSKRTLESGRAHRFDDQPLPRFLDGTAVRSKHLFALPVLS